MIVRLLRHVNYNLPIRLRMLNAYTTGLKLKNSLTNQLEDFVPLDGQSVKWYTCGPTVYSASHMGHARNYICNDMVRRVMKNHFKYNVRYGMNITDVQDKIIKNSRELGVEYFEFARKWQTDFFEDMESLGIEVPDYLTRVTEYMPEIIAFIDKIISNGYAYESNGSVYFNIEQYRTKFKYGKLKRIKEAETEAVEEEKPEKKNKEDFALWKAAKPGEPTWKSKWGEGRPGWHIQCSAMASAIFGNRLDIHSGGIDLIFPHHENELAQSEAYFNEPEWVKYFIHVGHLNILGSKMSKSLKNFISIKDVLKVVTPRVLKLYFFMHKYDVVLDYNPQTSFQQAEKKEKRYKNFFSTLQATIRDMKMSSPQKMSEQDFNFDSMLEETIKKIHIAFCDDINTPGVIQAIDEAIKKTNTYLTVEGAKLALLNKAIQTLHTPLEQMGLCYLQSTDDNKNTKEKDLIDSIVKFRDGIRENAKSDFKKILELCDKFRDEEMVEMNIRLEDKQIGEPAVWKYESKQILLKERERKLEDLRRREEEKKKNAEQKLKKMRINPKEMFLQDDKYSQFDENGIPTHVKEGKDKEKPINDKLRNKLTKQWNNQKEQYSQYLQMNGQKSEQKGDDHKKIEEGPGQ